MNNFVITYMVGTGIYDAYQQIKGKTAKDALEKAFQRKVIRLFGEDGRRADIIIAKGEYNKQSNTLRYDGNRLCYSWE